MSLHLRNPDLYKGLRAFIIEVLNVLTNEIRLGATVPHFSQFGWENDGQPGVYVRRQGNKPEFSIFVHQANLKIKALPSYQIITDSIRSDDIWGRHMGKLIGTASGRTLIDCDGILFGLFIDAIKESNSLEFSDDWFLRKTKVIEDFFYSDTTEFSRTTPLYGIYTAEPFVINENISIRPLDDAHIIDLLNDGVITSRFGGVHGDFIHNPPAAALVTSFLLPKIVGELDEAAGTAITKTLTEVWGQVTTDESVVIEMLTLILDVAVMPIGSVTKSLDPINGMRQIQKNEINSILTIFNKELTYEVKEKITILLPLLSGSAATSKSFLGIAIRRYALAMSRPSLDDKLIDLMISAEAIFLRVDHNELTFKLAYRAALLLGTNASDKKEIFKFINDAYSMRSKVVHGAKSFTKDSHDIEDLSNTINRLTLLIRDAILKMLEKALDPHASKDLIDWKELMFPEQMNES